MSHHGFKPEQVPIDLSGIDTSSEEHQLLAKYIIGIANVALKEYDLELSSNQITLQTDQNGETKNV